MSIDEIERIVEAFTVALNVFTWRDRLVGHDYFREAYRDYTVSTDEVLKSNYGQSRWASAQSVEKTLKGLLAIKNLPAPKGRDGHDLVKLGQTLKKQLNIEISPATMEAVNCSPDVRYGEEPSTQNEALVANIAVLEVLWQLSECSETNAILAEWHVVSLPGKLR